MKVLSLAAWEVVLYAVFLIGVTLFFPEAKPAFVASSSFAILIVVNVLAVVTALLEIAGLNKIIGNIIYFGGIILACKLILFP